MKEIPRQKKEKKGKLTIRYQSAVPPDPDSGAIEVAKEIAEQGTDVVVNVFYHDPEEDKEDSSNL